VEGLTVLQRGRLGQVLIEDSRGDGGPSVILTCQPWDQAGQHGIFVPRIAPDEPGPDPGDIEDKYKGVYPMLHDFVAEAVPRKPFVLRIDTSQLGGGVLGFNMETFIGKATELAADDVDQVRLTPENALEWGLVS
jgi:hypothetical protein